LLKQQLPLAHIAWLLNKQVSLIQAYAELVAQYALPVMPNPVIQSIG
jgi:hypothetical protein